MSTNIVRNREHKGDFTTSQAARFLKISPATVVGMVDKKGFGPGGSFLLPRSDHRRITPKGLIYILLSRGWERPLAEQAVQEFDAKLRTNHAASTDSDFDGIFSTELVARLLPFSGSTIRKVVDQGTLCPRGSVKLSGGNYRRLTPAGLEELMVTLGWPEPAKLVERYKKLLNCRVLLVAHRNKAWTDRAEKKLQALGHTYEVVNGFEAGFYAASFYHLAIAIISSIASGPQMTIYELLSEPDRISTSFREADPFANLRQTKIFRLPSCKKRRLVN